MRKGGRPETPAEKQAEVISRYKAGEGSSAIARSIGVCKKTVINILNRNGVGTRPVSDRKGSTYRLSPAAERRKNRARLPHSRHAQKPLWDRAFDVLTDDAAYWVGFLLADGNIFIKHYGSPRISVTLSAKDVGHVEKLRSYLRSTNAIVHGTHLDPAGKEQKTVKFAVTSERIAEMLMFYGVVPRKSQKASAHPVLWHNRHFWRGHFDGNGCIYKTDNSRVGYLCGSIQMVLQFQRACRTMASEFVLEARPGVFVTYPRNKLEMLTILDWMYADASEVLERKKLRWLAWVHKTRNPGA